MAKILVVDDALNVRTSLEKLLSEDGFETTTAADGDSALRVLDAERPDLILLDINVAGPVGFETLIRIKEAAPGIALILMLAYDWPAGDTVAAEFGVFDILIKPFDVAALKSLVRRALASGSG